MAPAKRKLWLWLTVVMLLSAGAYFTYRYLTRPPVSAEGRILAPGDIVDSLNGVYVYYNGRVGNTHGRNETDDGYNIGLKYQCGEFVKRYYLLRYGHRMPDPWGHAKDFFDPEVENGKRNKARKLLQFRNGEGNLPVAGNIIVFGPSVFNRYGHVAIVSEVSDGHIEIIQQNPGPRANSRATIGITAKNGKPCLDNSRILGWLSIYPEIRQPQFPNFHERRPDIQ